MTKKQKQFIIMLIVGFFVIAFLTGCDTFEAKMLEMQQKHITDWHPGQEAWSKTNAET
jgi:hypothetical protein